MPASDLKPFGPEIWLAEGGEAMVAGFRYPTRMAVIRLTGGGLFVWSPIALDETLSAQLAALGEVRHLIAPSASHHLFLGEWRAAYPEAALHGAPGRTPRRRDLAFASELGDVANRAWAADLDQVVVPNRIADEAVFFHRRSGTVLFCDLLQQFPPDWFRGWRAVVARLDLMTGTQARTPRKFRLAISDRKAARAALQRVLEWPSGKVVMAHGAPVTRDGRAFIAKAFAWLTG